MFGFILQIVSNSLNGIDVDKWDYIMRDSLHAGMGQGSAVIETDRMLRFYRPAYHTSDDAWHMSFRSSEYSNVLRIFSQRSRLFRSVYSHKTTLAIEAMFIDILNALDSAHHLRDLSLRACAGDDNAMEDFLRLDEHCLWAMASSQYLHVPETPLQIKANLRRSAQLCQRIEFRQLYSFAGKFFVIEKKILVGECSPPRVKYESDLSALLDDVSEAEDTPDVIEVEVRNLLPLCGSTCFFNSFLLEIRMISATCHGKEYAWSDLVLPRSHSSFSKQDYLTSCITTAAYRDSIRQLSAFWRLETRYRSPNPHRNSPEAPT